MYKIDLTGFQNNYSNNDGICREWALCRYFGIEKSVHDNTSYDKGSDIELPDGRNISVKSKAFSLMCGNLCEGCRTFEGIWRRYYKRCHSNLWAYITLDWQCYMMDKKEFSKFVHMFAGLERESQKNGGGLKIKGRAETQKRIEWLEAQIS